MKPTISKLVDQREIFAGTRERFGIEAGIEEQLSEFVIGHIRFWIRGHAVGNWSDAVDLLGCVWWLRDFSARQRDRFDPALWDLPATDVFHLLYDLVMSRDRSKSDRIVRDAYSRFHISHLGMSAFERVDMLLLKDESGRERCLWREADSAKIHESQFNASEMEAVAAEFCDAMKEAIDRES